jgi:hypothetical protein
MAIGLYQQVVGQVIAADLSLGRMYLEDEVLSKTSNWLENI